MKRYILPLLALSILTSCKNKALNQEQQQDTIATRSLDNSTAGLIAKFKPIFTGNWIKIKYIDKVITTKSPLAAYDEAQGITGISFTGYKLEGDSARVMFGYDNHESGEETMKFIAGKRPNSLQIGGVGEIQYSVVKGDTVLTLYWPNNNKATKATTYKKAPATITSLSGALDYFMNQGLVTGKYLMTDTNAVKSNVSLGATGMIKGFSPFKTYTIHADLNEEPMDNLDRLGFSDGKTIPYTWFTYKITGDTLKLFSTKPNADSSLLLVDKLRYTLIRQR